MDDAVEVGIEMIVQSFGTSWKMEDDGALCKSFPLDACVCRCLANQSVTLSPDMAAMKKEIAYAHSKKVEIGGVRAILSLGSTRLHSTRLDVLCACLGLPNGGSAFSTI